MSPKSRGYSLGSIQSIFDFGKAEAIAYEHPSDPHIVCEAYLNHYISFLAPRSNPPVDLLFKHVEWDRP